MRLCIKYRAWYGSISSNKDKMKTTETQTCTIQHCYKRQRYDQIPLHYDDVLRYEKEHISTKSIHLNSCYYRNLKTNVCTERKCFAHMQLISVDFIAIQQLLLPQMQTQNVQNIIQNSLHTTCICMLHMQVRCNHLEQTVSPGNTWIAHVCKIQMMHTEIIM